MILIYLDCDIASLYIYVGIVIISVLNGGEREHIFYNIILWGFVSSLSLSLSS